MTSLEIVKNKINNAKDMIIFYQLLIDKLDKKETTYEITKSNFFEYQEELKVLTKIKQDLEVLEILKHKTIDIKLLNEMSLDYYNFFYDDKYYKLTLEEFIKLKNWLEGDSNVN